ncbi:MAG TPA: CbbX protein [Acidimicrobiales bacterium]|jgi:probable Rubsico expression protein CbbX|nr:CbbX protein [Acidimicrobiales bacterium]
MSEAEASPGRGFSMQRSGSAAASGQAEANGDSVDDQAPEDDRLPDDAMVDVQSEEAAVHTKEVIERLERELVGLVPVKSRIREIGDLLLVDRLRRRFGIESTRPTLHMSFTGSPGTGKTTVAMRMAELLHRLGYLQKGHLVNVTRDDLVGQYIGHTAPKTKEVLKRAMGGVLFVDEAYYLYRQENERDYGQETIEILLQMMENERENLVVILAGYKDRMDQFFQSNPGMGSRIAHHIHFPDYGLDELVAIGQLMLAEQQYELSPDAEKAFRDYLERRMRQPRFANARSVRNALERARLRQAARIVGDPGRKLGRADLMRIEAEDILQSRVFDDDEEVDGADKGSPAASGGDGEAPDSEEGDAPDSEEANA